MNKFFTSNLLLALLVVSCQAAVKEPTVIPTPIPAATPQPSSTPISAPTKIPTATLEPLPILPDEMQRVVDVNGLELITDEVTGENRYVNKNGGIRFYQNEAGVWVDFHKEIVGKALNKEFWSNDGNSVDDGIVREYVRPVFTGGVVEKTFTLSGEQVSLLSLEMVVADENDSTVIREILVPIEITRLSSGNVLEGQWIMDESKTRLFTVDEILTLLTPGDQLYIDFIRIIPFGRPGYCGSFTKCGVVWDLNQEQDLNTLFARVDSGEVVDYWPKIIIPTFIIKTPDWLVKSWDLQN